MRGQQREPRSLTTCCIALVEFWTPRARGHRCHGSGRTGRRELEYVVRRRGEVFECPLERVTKTWLSLDGFWSSRRTAPALMRIFGGNTACNSQEHEEDTLTYARPTARAQRNENMQDEFVLHKVCSFSGGFHSFICRPSRHDSETKHAIPCSP